MKKILAILSLAFASTASAQTTVALQHDTALGHETKLSVAQKTSIGSFDAGVLNTRYARGSGSANGYDVGYSNGVKFGRLEVNGRAGFGHLNDGFGPGYTARNYVSAAVDARMGVYDEFGVFINARHRNPNGFGPTQNRYQAGVDLVVTEGIGARFGASHVRQAGRTDNGLTATVNYTF